MLNRALRYIETLVLGHKFRKQWKECGCRLTETDVKAPDVRNVCSCVRTYKAMLCYHHDATALQFLEGCLETAPQLVLNCCIYFGDYFKGVEKDYQSKFCICSVRCSFFQGIVARSSALSLVVTILNPTRQIF